MDTVTYDCWNCKYGLVELEDGHMRKVHPSDVVFADGGDFDNTAFRPQKEEA